MPTISGTVYDYDGEPAQGRIVRAYRRDTGGFLAEVYTSSGESSGDLNYPQVSLLLNGDYPTEDPDFENVVLLLKGDGADASTTIRDSSKTPKVITVFGNARIRTAQSKFGGSSLYFDGNGDSVRTPWTVDFAISSGDFTLETWVKFDVLNTGTWHNLISTWSDSAPSGQKGWRLLASGDNGGRIFFANEGDQLDATNAVSVGPWFHIAVTRHAGTGRMFIDGVLKSEIANMQFSDAPGLPNVLIGVTDINSAWPLNGYLDDLRITKGVARYTANFTPPTSAFRGAFEDRSPAGLRVDPFGNVRLETTIKKYGTGSLYFDGTGDYLSVPNSSDINLGSVYTIEAQVRFSALPSSGTQSIIVFRWDGGATKRSYFLLLDNNSGTPNLAFGASPDGGSANARSVTFNWTPTLNQWYHLTGVNDGSSLKLFIDGILVNTNNVSVSTFSTDIDATIGGFSGGNNFNGYIDDLRITKGVARYTTNFTPPTAPLPVVEGSLPVGGYFIHTAHTGEVDVLFLDDAAGETYNDLVQRTVPV
jgi:hypothetical protein